MALVVAEFFEIMGISLVPPTNIQELIPYLLTIFIGLFLISVVFGIIGGLFRLLFDFRIR